MIGKILVSAAVTGLLLSGAVGAPSATAQESVALASDSNFILTAGSLGLLQEKLGKLAQKKGSSSGVKEFGRQMVADYSKVNEELEAAAKQAAYPAPVLLRQHQKTFDRFNRMGRSSFDREYMEEMMKNHQEEVRLFRQESENGRVQSLKQVASRMLPQTEQRLTLAAQTAGLVGADATASSADANDDGSSSN
jgi:putative membrane protein